MIEETIADPDPAARRALLDALALAFRDNPMNITIHGDDPKRRVRANRAGLRSLVLDSGPAAVTRAIRHEGRVVGGFVVVPPGQFPLPSARLRRQIGCLINQGGRAMDRWSEVSIDLGLYHPEERHWYLAVLGIVPWLHGRGLGSRLVEALVRMTRSDPCPIYLESDREASVRFYLARGFVVRSETQPHGVPCWCLGQGFPGATLDLCDSVREL